MTNSASDVRRKIEVKEQNLGKFYKLSVQYFGTVVSDEGSKPEDCTNHRSFDKSEAIMEI